MSKKQDELLMQAYIEIDRQISNLDEDWLYYRKRLKDASQEYIDMTWHLFNYDEQLASVYSPVEVTQLNSTLVSNNLELQDVGGLVRIHDKFHSLIQLYKEVEYYLDKELMNDNVNYLSDESSYNSLSSSFVFSDYRVLDIILASSSEFTAYISTLNEVQKNRLIIELKYFLQVVTNLFNVIENEYQMLNGRVYKDISRIQPAYNLMLKITS